MPRIYVASLSDYNAGTLHGVWVDLTAATVEEIEEQVSAMLAASPDAAKTGYPAEEWAIHDHEGFDSYAVSEWSSFDEIVTYCETVEGWDFYKRNAFGLWLDHETIEDDSGDRFEDVYEGDYEDEEDYGLYWAQEASDLYARLEEHGHEILDAIDWERYGESILCNLVHSDVSGWDCETDTERPRRMVVWGYA